MGTTIIALWINSVIRVTPIAVSNLSYIVKSEVAETKMCRDGQQTLTSCTLFQILHLQHTVLFQTKSPMSTFRFVSATTNWTSTNQQILESMWGEWQELLQWGQGKPLDMVFCLGQKLNESHSHQSVDSGTVNAELQMQNVLTIHHWQRAAVCHY